MHVFCVCIVFSVLWLIYTDSQGNEEWNQTFGGGSNDWGNSGKQTLDGGYIAVGMTGSYDSGYGDIWLIKTDSQGLEEWNQTFGNSDYFEDGRRVLQTSDNGFIIDSNIKYDPTSGYGQRDVWIIKTDNGGNVEWEKNYDWMKYQSISDIQQTSDGGFIYIYTRVHEEDEETFYHSHLIKMDISGIDEWQIIDEEVRLQNVKQTSDSGYIIGGYLYLVDNNDCLLIKTDPNGYFGE